MSRLITILDDEPDMLEVVESFLEDEGFKVNKFTESERFFQSIKKEIPDLIILDLMLPESNGFEICKYLKGNDMYSDIPVIMFSAKDGETDKVVGLELGADDYVTKPFSGKELAARVKAVLRRHSKNKNTKKINVNENLIIDREKHEVLFDRRKIDLTTTEFRILELLSSRRGIVFSRARILDHLWGNEKLIIDRSIDVHINRLREKLGVAASLIKCVRGVGYKLDDSEKLH